MEGNYREGKGGLKKACGTPHLSFVLSVTELVLCRVTGWLSCCCAAPAYIDPVWLVKNSHDLVRNSFCLSVFLFQPYP